MALPTTLSKVRIEGNSIDTGTYFNGVSVTDYTYSYAMDISASGTIKNNIISGCIGSSTTSTNLVSIANASCNISGNQFVRGSSDLNAYINITGTNDQIITGNVFDKSEASAGDEFLVKGLTENSTYNNNKNQIGFVPVAFFHYNNENTNFTKYMGTSMFTDLYVGNTTQSTSIFTIPLSKHLPKGAQAKQLKVGIFADGGATVDDVGGDNFLAIDVGSFFKNPSSFSSGTGCGMLDFASITVSNVWSDTLSFDTATLFANLFASSQFITLTINDDSNSSIEDTELLASITVKCKLGSGSADIFLSPLVIKYTY